MRLVLARRDLLILLGWQACALLLTGTGYFSQRLAERNAERGGAILLPTICCSR